MTRVNRSYIEQEAEAGTKSPILYPSEVEGSPDVLALTIMAADLFRKGTMARLEFYEFPGYILWVRGRELLALSSALGDDSELWQHRQCVVEKVRRNNPRTGGTLDKYVVAPADTWGEVLP